MLLAKFRGVGVQVPHPRRSFRFYPATLVDFRNCVCYFRLSVEEHLWFYSRLKGMDPTSVKEQIDKMLVDIGLPEKRTEQSNKLSGNEDRIAIGERGLNVDEKY